MPKPRYGKIPATRLGEARRVRDAIISDYLSGGKYGYAVVSIQAGGYSVAVRVYENVELPLPIPRLLGDIPIRSTRIKRPVPGGM